MNIRFILREEFVNLGIMQIIDAIRDPTTSIECDSFLEQMLEDQEELPIRLNQIDLIKLETIRQRKHTSYSGYNIDIIAEL
jgi:hypothetical protein